MPEARGPFGPYELLDQLGTGGMGVVYRARDTRTGDLVALKTVRVAEAAMLRSLRREIHALRRVRHPCVVRIVAEGLSAGLPWYAMEVIPGRSLREYIDAWWQRHGAGTVSPDALTVPDGDPTEPDVSGVHRVLRATPGSSTRPAANGHLREALSLVRRLCAGLSFLHGEGIVHRDLKPENVIVRPDGTPVLMDFGLVGAFGGAVGREPLQVGGVLEGSFGYMAPEQINGDLVDARTDLYALGCILYEIVVGEPPFIGEGYGVLGQHLLDTPVPLRARVEGVPPALDALVARLLAKRPRERLGYAADVAAALAALGAEDLRHPAPSPRPYLYRPAFAGRADVLSQLEALLRDAQRGAGRAALVGGESGAGKTRLASELATAANRAGFRVVTAECLPAAREGAGAGAPLHAFVPLLQAVADHCRARGIEETARVLGPRGPVLAGYEPSLAALPGQENQPEPPRLAAQAARDRVAGSLAETLAAFAARDPLLLVLDDLQWADELSLGCLAYLLGHCVVGARVLVLGTYRTEETTEALREIARAPGVVHLPLARIDRETVAAIVGDMLALQAPPATFVHFLTEQSMGNPFFVAEYLRTAVHEQLVRRDEAGQWRLAGDGRGADSLSRALPEPGLLRDLVSRRLQGLSPGARALAEVAAVLGREFDGALVEELAGLGDLASLEALDELLTRQVVEEAAAGRLRFVHDKLREIAYGGIAPARRRVLHAAAAETIEARCREAGTLAGHYGVLAHHFTEAGDAARAVEYLERAAEQALASFANRAAVGFLSRAIALADGAMVPVARARRARWEGMLGEAHVRLAEYVAARAYLVRALRGHGHPYPSSRVALVGDLGVNVLRQVAHRVAPWRVRAPSEAARESCREAAEAYRGLAEVSFFGNDMLGLLHATVTSLNLAERAGAARAMVHGFGTVAVVAGLARLGPVARAYRARSLAMAQAEGGLETIAYADQVAATYGNCVGDWDAVDQACTRACALWEQLGDRFRWETCKAIQGYMFLARGEYARARACWRDAHASAYPDGAVQVQLWARAGELASRLPEGEPEATLLADVEVLLGRGVARAEAVLGEGLLAAGWLARGEHARARQAAEKALRWITEQPPATQYVLWSVAGVAEVFLALWDCAPAASVEADALWGSVVRAARALRAFGWMMPVGAPRAVLMQGEVRWREGRRVEARRCFRRALAAAERFGMMPEQGLAHLALGRRMEAHEMTRWDHLRRAREIFAALGAAGYEEQARRAFTEPPAKG